MSGPWVILMLAGMAAVVGPVVVALIVRALWRRGRRRLGWALAGLTALSWGLGVWAFFIEPNTLTVSHVTVESAQWRGPPIRIGVISDTHVSAPHVDAERVQGLVRRMNGERPDVVVLLGDYTGGHRAADARPTAENARVLEGVEAFAGLQAPLGVHGVLGNHDSWFEEAEIADAMRRGRATPLRNQAIRIARPGGDFWIAGVADMHSRSNPASVPHTMATVTDDAPVIAITHWPDPFEQMPPRVALTLAGHTHCGQINLPLIGRPVLPSPASYRWPCGLYDVGGRKLFVTGGVGVSILPARFRAPPEIVIVTLRAPE